MKKFLCEGTLMYTLFAGTVPVNSLFHYNNNVLSNPGLVCIQYKCENSLSLQTIVHKEHQPPPIKASEKVSLSDMNKLVLAECVRQRADNVAFILLYFIHYFSFSQDFC